MDRTTSFRRLNSQESISPIMTPKSDNLGDVILGGAGNDYLLGGRGDDVLDVGSTEDSASDTNGAFAGAWERCLDRRRRQEWMHGNGGDDQMFGGDGDDVLFGDEEVSPDGVAGNDYMEGGAGDDRIYRHGGDDVMAGGDRIDEIVGGAGRDLLYGGDGNDKLSGDSSDIAPADPAGRHVVWRRGKQ